jgi:pimeloyl-ACP methyl ester carboxylesterase
MRPKWVLSPKRGLVFPSKIISASSYVHHGSPSYEEDAMSKPDQEEMLEQHAQRSTDNELRERLLAELPVFERRVQVHGVSTAVLEGGDGPPVVLLHGPGGHAASWMRVIPNLVATYRVIAPDLPGQGASESLDGRFDAGQTVAWLDDVVDYTCATPPAVVGHALGGAIAARFASEHSAKLNRLVLVDALGLSEFQPAPDFGQALNEFLSKPRGDTHDRLWSRCAFDLETMRSRMGERWEWLKAYNLDRAMAPDLRAVQRRLMERFGLPVIPEEDLARISVRTSLIWGRHDRATSLSVAEATSARFGWPLHVIEHCADDPALEQPEAFLRALHTILKPFTGEGK